MSSSSRASPLCSRAIPTSTKFAPGACAADLVLNLHGGTRSMLLTAACRAKLRAGFGHHRYSFIYTHKIPRAQEILGVERPVHTAEHLASAMFWLGVPRAEIPRAKLFAGDTAESRAVCRDPSVCVGAGENLACGPIHRNCAKAYRARTPCSSPDRATMLRRSQLPRSGRTHRSIGVKSLMAGASLFIGNDSGPAHIAAAFGVPVVVIVRIVRSGHVGVRGEPNRKCCDRPRASETSRSTT